MYGILSPKGVILSSQSSDGLILLRSFQIKAFKSVFFDIITVFLKLLSSLSLKNCVQELVHTYKQFISNNSQYLIFIIYYDRLPRENSSCLSYHSIGRRNSDPHSLWLKYKTVFFKGETLFLY